jgi:hypothetical protein
LISTFEQQLADEIPSADVVDQAAEFGAAERVVAEILNDGASVGVGIRILDLIFGQAGNPLQQEGTDVVSPEEVYNFLVGQNRICGQGIAAHEDNQSKCPYAFGKQATGIDDGADHSVGIPHFHMPGETRRRSGNLSVALYFTLDHPW